MIQKIQELQARIEGLTAATLDEVEELRIKYISKKGEVQALVDEFRSLSPEEKRAAGQALNALKAAALDKINSLRDAVNAAASKEEAAALDLTRTAASLPLGSRHPLSLVREEIISIFSRLGFSIAEGPEIEDDWHVFS